MTASHENAQSRNDLNDVSFVRIDPAADAGVVVLETIGDDFIHRFQACCAASDAIWQCGWLACRTDGERGAWIEHLAAYLEDRLDA